MWGRAAPKMSVIYHLPPADPEGDAAARRAALEGPRAAEMRRGAAVLRKCEALRESDWLAPFFVRYALQRAGGAAGLGAAPPAGLRELLAEWEGALEVRTRGLREAAEIPPLAACWALEQEQGGGMEWGEYAYAEARLLRAAAARRGGPDPGLALRVAALAAGRGALGVEWSLPDVPGLAALADELWWSPPAGPQGLLPDDAAACERALSAQLAALRAAAAADPAAPPLEQRLGYLRWGGYTREELTEHLPALHLAKLAFRAAPRGPAPRATATLPAYEERIVELRSGTVLWRRRTLQPGGPAPDPAAPLAHLFAEVPPSASEAGHIRRAIAAARAPLADFPAPAAETADPADSASSAGLSDTTAWPEAPGAPRAEPLELILERGALAARRELRGAATQDSIARIIPQWAAIRCAQAALAQLRAPEPDQLRQAYLTLLPLPLAEAAGAYEGLIAPLLQALRPPGGLGGLGAPGLRRFRAHAYRCAAAGRGLLPLPPAPDDPAGPEALAAPLYAICRHYALLAEHREPPGTAGPPGSPDAEDPVNGGLRGFGGGLLVGALGGALIGSLLGSAGARQ